MTASHTPASAVALPDFDPIAVEVFTNRLLAVTESMASNMMRASFSPQIKERRDFSVGIFDHRGQLIAQGTHIPVHLGSLLGAVEAVCSRYAPEDIRDGDVYMCNDPYAAGGTHLPDISIITPIFIGGLLVAFAANIGHHSDVGGPIPGSTSARARTIYEEGLRIPILRVARSHVVDEDVIALVALNSRLPQERALDLRVQVSTNAGGAIAVRALVARMGGIGAFHRAIDDVLAYTQRRAQRRIDNLTPGRHSFTTWLDDDGSGEGEPVPVVATLFVEEGKLVVDLAGSGPESKGALNVAESALRATVYYCVKAMLDRDLMANSGMARAIEIRAPQGSIVNPRPPAACGARTIACQRVAGAIFGAFRALVPRDRLMASSNDTLPQISFSGQLVDTDSFYLCGETLGGGGGARDDADGMDAIHVHVTNSLNLPSEVLENEFPLHVELYGLAEDSAGAGRHRGGLGIVREVRVLRGDTVMSSRSDSHFRGAEGAEGGGEGGRGLLLLNAGLPHEQKLASKVSQVVLARGDTVRIQTPGGAGFGDPAERPIEALADDLQDGVMSMAVAEKLYGAERARAARARLPARSV
ncbi:hydantoinase B/oxoprolinase family protein [Hydrogenophaga sp. BPS33]|uniref:hydantoinase B/oxoprolinase family protein n=1 Tax=Hydrogenophaga sp. BPS33 TaxID=2651974 RepID=UPI00131F6128|nr:hydantoinase B/oxoprolinase family protein [Hydrogenophaga sp. BPS33]QHE87798.1 hydantoinase B/oxoprolinase family protein [Hydrogenophaga sp. BPS33]